MKWDNKAMERKSRKKYAVLNSSISTALQIVQLLAQFVSRSLFIHYLGMELLGLNGLFINVLTYLNFAELGIGSAITYSLYKPLNDRDYKQIRAIMVMFRKIYMTIGTLILFVGVGASLFIPSFTGGKTFVDGIDVRVAFLLALLNTALSYFWSYKRTLLIADQLGYLNVLNTVLFNIVGQALQVTFLIVYKNFYLFLLIQVLVMLLSNLRISMVVNKKYPYLKEKNDAKVDDSVIQNLKKNIFGMSSAKLGGIVVNGTDNLLLSFYVGLNAVGLYSNYTMIISGITQVVSQLVSSVTASIGNLAVQTKDSMNQVDKEKKIFNQYFTISSVLAVILAVGFAGFSASFVKIWIGTKAVFPLFITTIISINFLIQLLRQPLINYTNAYGLYWQERWKPLFEASVNFILSWILVKYTDLSVAGVLIGTIASNLLVNLVWESWIVIKYAIHANLWEFLRNYISYIVTGSVLIYLAGVMSDYLFKSGIAVNMVANFVNVFVTYYIVLLINKIIGLDGVTFPSIKHILKIVTKLRR